MPSLEVAYQRYFEIQGEKFVDNGNAVLVSLHSTDNWITGLKRMGFIAGGIAAGFLLTNPMTYAAIESTKSLKDPSDAPMVGLIAAGTIAAKFAGMLTGASLSEYTWEKFFRRPERIISFSLQPNFVQQEIF